MKYLAMIGGLALTLAVAGRAQVVQANCEERLDNNAYLCQFTSQEGDSFEFCMVFNSETPEVGDFEMFVDGLGPLGCSCATKNKKKFKQSNNFLCVGAADNVSAPDAAAVFGGKATSKGKKIKKGQAVFGDGFSYVYTCKLEPLCGL